MGGSGGVFGGLGAAVGAGVNFISGQNASNAQQQAAVASQQQAQTQFQQQQANLAPYLASGTQNLSALNAAMPDLQRKFTMQDFQQDPGYQFQLNQGLQGMQRSAAASGMLNSAGTQQGLNNYAQGMANTDYQQALSNFTNNQNQRFNMLSGMAGLGLQSTGMANASSANYTNQFANANNAIGNAQAAGDISMGNSINQGIAGLANLPQGTMKNASSNMFGSGDSMAGANSSSNMANGAYLTGGGTSGGLAGMGTQAGGGAAAGAGDAGLLAAIA